MPYMVIGGQAVLVHGEPRLTRDIDITLGLTAERVHDVLELVSSLGLKVSSMRRRLSCARRGYFPARISIAAFESLIDRFENMVG